MIDLPIAAGRSLAEYAPDTSMSPSATSPGSGSGSPDARGAGPDSLDRNGNPPGQGHAGDMAEAVSS